MSYPRATIPATLKKKTLTGNRTRKIQQNDNVMVTWTEEEDQRLQILVNTFGSKSWYTISKMMLKPEIKCHTRWMELNNMTFKSKKKGTWSEEEDKILTEKVKEIGLRNWILVSKHLPGRIGKQCRERWYKCLDPSISKEEWTLEEDMKVVKLYYILGNKWSKISK